MRFEVAIGNHRIIAFLYLDPYLFLYSVRAFF